MSWREKRRTKTGNQTTEKISKKLIINILKTKTNYRKLQENNNNERMIHFINYK